MGKILGIDYGEKRIGLAISSADQRFVFPHSTLNNDAPSDRIGEIKNICIEEDVEKIVVGLPLDQEGKMGIAAAKVTRWAEELASASGRDVVFEDERYSTVMAGKFQRQGGRSVKEARTSIDQTAAAVILETYIDRHHG
ncbi:MAG: Holliday junction resolvase RuvX [Patescibacteria group bacterium]